MTILDSDWPILIDELCRSRSEGFQSELGEAEVVAASEGDLPVEEIAAQARKYALLNAFEHEGKAQAGAVLGKVLGERPQYRARAKELAAIARRAVEEVNVLPAEQQRREIEERWPELLERRAEKVEEKVLPPLPALDKYPQVVTRFAPNPDFVLHLGSARAIILSHDYARMYGGGFYLRFEDTDPRQKKPVLEFYDKIREDLEWLGCRWDGEFIQSDRLGIYYDYAEKLVGMGGAYICTCPAERFREYSLAQTPCPCRDLPPETHLDRWGRMLDGRFGEGEATLRVKTDLHHPNPAVRDWAGLRIIETAHHPHPRVGDRYRVWPLYNWSCGLDDHLLGITHIIRGKEHLTNEVRQRFLYNHLGWDYPPSIHYGRLKITGALLSKSKIKAGLEGGEYKGIDDPRLATFAALRRRGIMPDGIRRMMVEVGVNPVDITLSWETLYNYNRKILDPNANRYYFVENPVELKVRDVGDEYVANPPRHPDHPERGSRTLRIQPQQGEVSFLISARDLGLVETHPAIRLMGFFNVKVENPQARPLTASFLGGGYSEAKKLGAPLIHCLPKGSGLEAEVVMPDGGVWRGLIEEGVRDLKGGDIIQMERVGFGRIDVMTSEIVRIWYAHK